MYLKKAKSQLKKTFRIPFFTNIPLKNYELNQRGDKSFLKPFHFFKQR